MRLAIVHDVSFTFETPAKALIALVRLSPRHEAGLFVHDWRLDVSTDAPVRRFHDAFGNVVHTFSLEGPIEEASVTATGTVETEEVNGVVGPSTGRVPPEVFLRETPATRISGGVRALSETIRAAAAADDRLDFAHRLNAALTESFDSEGNDLTDLKTPQETMESGKGTAADLAHLFVAACRVTGLPARLVSGYRTTLTPAGPADGPLVAEGTLWSWAEALIDRLGWVSFDPTTGLSVTEAYVRIATAPDALGAAPVRSVATGGDGATISQTVRVREGAVGIHRRRPVPRAPIRGPGIDREGPAKTSSEQ